MRRENSSPACPMDSLLRLLMGPWTTYILWLLYSNGVLRFGQLKRFMPDVSAKVLTERLRMLETADLVHRDYQPTIPPQVSYSLTVKGQDLQNVLEGLNVLARKWRVAEQAGLEREAGHDTGVDAQSIAMALTLQHAKSAVPPSSMQLDPGLAGSSSSP
jgi:DNA-binding HxlR family transcriptional regulator